jgi:hypothetical protein
LQVKFLLKSADPHGHCTGANRHGAELQAAARLYECSTDWMQMFMYVQTVFLLVKDVLHHAQVGLDHSMNGELRSITNLCKINKA